MSDLLQITQFYDKYSRFDYVKNKREDWNDTVNRVFDYLMSFDKENSLTSAEKTEIFDAIYKKEVMPSMRNMATAGEAAKRSNIASFNCAFVALDSLYAFKEAVLILMAGTGLGYSVENIHTSKLPRVCNKNRAVRHIVVDDTTEAWAQAIYYTIGYTLKGATVTHDFSKIRPAGSPLKTKGGRASGSQVLQESLTKIIQIIENSRSRGYLRPLDVHDIMCHIARCIVSGGHRRSAMICLFDYTDKDIFTCKSPGNIENNPQRFLANNSAVFDREYTLQEINEFVNTMFESYAGEPGIFSRLAVQNTLPERRKVVEGFGTNPCGEIALRPAQFCNLSSVVCRPEDTLESILHKVKIATIIGTLQAMSDYFPGLRPIWKQNQEQERLLGVDLNGVMDIPHFWNKEVLTQLNNHAIQVNKEYSGKFGVNPAAAITCIKPSGNSSVLLNTSPGLHARWSQFYIRRMQLHKDNPILPVLQMYSVPTQKSNYLPDTYVAEFPVKSPEGAIVNGSLSALEQLENWKLFKLYWTEHNPSCTISYTESDREDIIQWIFSNQSILSGLSFLPKSDSIYEQMPYESITEQQYNILIQNFPTEIDWNTLHSLEQGLGDKTNASQLAACEADKCLI